jgi:hypothetical protein
LVCGAAPSDPVARDGPVPNHLLARTLERDIESREHLGGELFGLGQQPEHDVLGPDVVMAKLARLRRGGTQDVGGRAG